MLDAYIYDGLRTPFGRHAGALAPVRPDDLLATATGVALIELALLLAAMPSPATHAILAQLKAGETVYQPGELPKTL